MKAFACVLFGMVAGSAIMYKIIKHRKKEKRNEKPWAVHIQFRQEDSVPRISRPFDRIQEIEEELDIALEEENYILAAKLRDELHAQKQTQNDI